MQRVILGPSQPAVEEIRVAAQRHKGGRVRIAVAWARDEGVCWLLDALNERIPTLEAIVGLNERGTTVEALLRLLHSGTTLHVFYKHPSQTFHPKLYWFDDGLPEPQSATVIIGSSNLTRGGLVTNFETSLVAQLNNPPSDSDRYFMTSLSQAWNELLTLPYAHSITTEQEIKRLYESGYLVLERTITRERRRQSRSGKPLRDLPTAPPPRPAPPKLGPVDIPFAIEQEPLGDEAPEDVDPEGSIPLPDRFFVRTLTANDVEKLHGRRPGTFEPDLGETARNEFPAFWGWPDKYQPITRRLTRLEWTVAARLISSSTPTDGVSISVILWFREEREGHAAEHRMRPGPIGIVREATPPTFGTSSLFVVEQAPEGLATSMSSGSLHPVILAMQT